jgi:thiol-disulfide isomerase/thioredoxin
MSRKIFLSVLAMIFLGSLLPAQVELLGEITPEEILRSLPDWKAVVESYSPNLEIVSRLQAVNEEIQIELFLGTWCPDSKQHVSAYIKVMDMVQNPLLKTIYIGIPRDKDGRAKYVLGKDIQKIPTFIVTIRGQEAGRIIETPQTSVEEDLWRIIQGKL